jgi:hypothetical protein
LAMDDDMPRRRRARRPPARSVESRENQMIALAVDVAEDQLRTGRASAQVITHYLKLATQREQLEQQRLKSENELLQARVQNLAEQADIKELYGQALMAMRSYQGGQPDDSDQDV